MPTAGQTTSYDKPTPQGEMKFDPLENNMAPAKTGISGQGDEGGPQLK